MYIWPNGEVTGSVHLATLEAFQKALAAGGSLDDFAENIPPSVSPDDYPRPAKPKPEKAAAKPAAKEA